MRAGFVYMLLLSCGLVPQIKEDAHALRYAGCYEMRATHGTAEIGPASFRLLAQRVGSEYFVLRTPGSQWLFSEWRPKEGPIPARNRLEIVWGTGFVSYDVTLSQTSKGWVGISKFFTDDGQKHPPVEVKAHRVACKRDLDDLLVIR